MSATDGKQTQRMTPNGLPRNNQPSTFSTEWLTAKEAAAHSKEHRTVCKWANEGKIPAHALSGAERHMAFLTARVGYAAQQLDHCAD